jgi:starch-binding outer membrane protein, SusD/RagB family
MKITKKYIGALLAVVMAASSCSDSFLEEEPSTSVSVENAILTDGDMMEATAGMYRILQNYFFFGRNSTVFGDLLADNVYMSSSNSSRLLQHNNFTFVAGNAETRQLWAQSYYAILQANRIIGSSIATNNNVNQLRGEAYAVRALCYLNLVNWFATPYTVDPAAAGVPLVTISTDVAGAFGKPSRNTVGEVYTQILADLEQAYQLIPATTASIHVGNTNFISKYGAKALEARAQLYKGDYQKARDAALLVVQNGGYALSATKAAFTAYWGSTLPRTDKLETIFEINNSAVANNGVEGHDWMYNKAGLGDLLVTDDTYALYSATDMRRELIVEGTRGGNQVYYVNKYQNVTNADRDEIKMVRYAEVLLTLSESYARLNDTPNALLYLNQVAQNRDPAQVAYTLTGSALVSAILTERRKELAFEGLRFFDLARTNVDFTRQNMGAKGAAFYPNVLKTDFRRLQPIPEVEIAANPNVAQNPGYSK